MIRSLVSSERALNIVSNSFIFTFHIPHSAFPDYASALINSFTFSRLGSGLPECLIFPFTISPGVERMPFMAISPMSVILTTVASMPSSFTACFASLFHLVAIRASGTKHFDFHTIQSSYKIALNRYPTPMIVTVMIETNTARSLTFSTFLRMIISGSDSAVTAIIKASTVPMLMPFSISA